MIANALYAASLFFAVAPSAQHSTPRIQPVRFDVQIFTAPVDLEFRFASTWTAKKGEFTLAELEGDQLREALAKAWQERRATLVSGPRMVTVEGLEAKSRVKSGNPDRIIDFSVTPTLVAGPIVAFDFSTKYTLGAPGTVEEHTLWIAKESAHLSLGKTMLLMTTYREPDSSERRGMILIKVVPSGD